MEFQNTIAYGTFTNAGGELTPTANVWSDFTFQPTPVVAKNVNVPIGTSAFEIQVQQTGMYFIEFNFIAQDGDSKTYNIRPYVNNVGFNTTGEGQTIKFFQQPTSQKYEVSTHGLFNLTKGDKVKWKILTPVLSSVDFYTNTLRMNIFNLQQIGIH